MNEQATKLNEARNDVEKKREELQNNLDAANKRAQDIEAKTREGKAATDKEIQDLNNALKNANADFANTTEQLNTLRIQNEEHRRVQANHITKLEQQLKKCNSTKLDEKVLSEIQNQYQEFQNLQSINTQGLEGIIGSIGEEIKKLNELSEQCENCDGNLNISVTQPDGKGGRDDITQEKPVKLTVRGGKNKKKGGYKYKKTKKNKLQLKNKLTRRK
jgi:chromosome segregation ATPase